MSEVLGNYVEFFGGKLGPLLYIRDHESGGEKLVPAIEPYNLKDLSERTEAGELNKAIQAACRDEGTNYTIARTSLPGLGDFQSLVDALPTELHILRQGLTSEKIIKIAKRLMEKCNDPLLRKFALAYGIDFRPERVVVGFSPEISLHHSTVTEHPNQPDTTMVDIAGPGYNNSVDFIGGEKVCHSGESLVRELHTEAFDLRRRVHEMGILDHANTAFQYEGAANMSRRGIHKLVQIRYFAPKKIADFELEGDRVTHCRVMGVTSSEGLKLPYLDGITRRDAVKFENDHPKTPYFLDLMPHATTPKLTLEEPLVHLAGYRVSMGLSLSHQNTRYAQQCLRNCGVVLLGESLNLGHLRSGDVVRVVCDGVRVQIAKC